MTALDQRGRNDDGQEPAIAQQMLGLGRARGLSPDILERLKQKAGKGSDDRPCDDDPDQLARDDVVHEIATRKGACGERRRAPEPHRPVVKAIAGNAAQGVRIR